MSVDPEQRAAPRHDRTVWAAYVLGYETGWLRARQQSIWDCRTEVSKGRVKVESELPCGAAQLVDAIEVLTDGGYCDAGDTLRLARSSERLKHAFDRMLADLRPGAARAEELDWDCSDFPGFEHWLELYRAESRAIEGQRHLEDWRLLGERFAERDSDVYVDAATARELCEHFRRLNAHRDYPGIEDVIRSLESPARPPPLVRVDELQRRLREYLWPAARPRPWLVLNGRSVRLFDAEVRRLTRSELGILWVLAETPRRAVTRIALISRANLGCSQDDVASHVSRLNKKLRKVIESKFVVAASRPNGGEDLIMGSRDGSRNYQLEIDRIHVAMESPRPG
jgi:hypothetical protein